MNEVKCNSWKKVVKGSLSFGLYRLEKNQHWVVPPGEVNVVLK